MRQRTKILLLQVRISLSGVKLGSGVWAGRKDVLLLDMVLSGRSKLDYRRREAKWHAQSQYCQVKKVAHSIVYTYIEIPVTPSERGKTMRVRLRQWCLRKL